MISLHTRHDMRVCIGSHIFKRTEEADHNNSVFSLLSENVNVCKRCPFCFFFILYFFDLFMIDFLDYFDCGMGVLVDPNNPTILEFAASLLRETLLNPNYQKTQLGLFVFCLCVSNIYLIFTYKFKHAYKCFS